MHRGGHRREARQRRGRNPALGSIHAWRPQEHRTRRDRVGAQDGGIWRGRNPVDQHGS
ncbi:Phosphoribosyl-AMP cyclohydrolase [Caballeronia sordidicola]|uniref:Phosphoribosyl-AMP cyclohydrolase n=1 Tax=Caballeronia sordidicola TaxID=196367 RepID=A0A226WLH6_CABSO|nr:Phosphoribosyl-AMP cyclohydrolase [Caballeronia sordidicola]